MKRRKRVRDLVFGDQIQYPDWRGFFVVTNQPGVSPTYRRVVVVRLEDRKIVSRLVLHLDGRLKVGLVKP